MDVVWFDQYDSDYQKSMGIERAQIIIYWSKADGVIFNAIYVNLQICFSSDFVSKVFMEANFHLNWLKMFL